MARALAGGHPTAVAVAIGRVAAVLALRPWCLAAGCGRGVPRLAVQRQRRLGIQIGDLLLEFLRPGQ